VLDISAGDRYGELRDSFRPGDGVENSRLACGGGGVVGEKHRCLNRLLMIGLLISKQGVVSEPSLRDSFSFNGGL